MIKYFLYARKSSEGKERQLASIPDQLKYLKQLAKDLNLAIVKEFTESKSAKEPNRKQFNLMLQGIKNGEAQGILSWKLDRLSRNPIDSGQLQWMLQQGTIQHIKTIERDYYPKDNVLMMSVEMGMANQFIQELRITTARGMKSKAERGWFPGKAPLGYKSNSNKVKGDKEIIVDEERFYLVRKIFDMILTGTYSVSKVYQIMTQEFNLSSNRNGKLALSNFYNILTNTFYFGQFEYPKNSGNFYIGKHIPMITEEEFNKIQIILGRKSVRKPRTKNFAYTGMIHCAECGAQITAEDRFRYLKNGKVLHFVYYHCTKKIKRDCTQKYLELKKLESQIMDLISKISIPTEFADWAIKILKEENEKETRESKQLLDKFEKDYKTVIKELGQLLNMKIKEMITDDEYLEKKRELEEKKLSVKRLIDNFDNQADEWIKNVEKLFDFAKNVQIKFETGSIDDKRQILSFLGSNLRLNDKKLSINIEKPMIYLEKISKETKRYFIEKIGFEPQLNPIESIGNEDCLPDFSKLYPRQESNLRPAV